MHFNDYPAARLMIDSISSRLTEEENKFRKWLMEYTINTGEAYNINSYPAEELQGLDVQAMVERLTKKKALVIDGRGNINFIYPVSALPTHHKVHLRDGRSFSAMCAIDAMGAAFTFNQDLHVESKCSECGEVIHVQVRDGKIVELLPETTHALHVDLKKSDNWAGSC